MEAQRNGAKVQPSSVTVCQTLSEIKCQPILLTGQHVTSCLITPSPLVGDWIMSRWSRHNNNVIKSEIYLLHANMSQRSVDVCQATSRG